MRKRIGISGEIVVAATQIEAGAIERATGRNGNSDVGSVYDEADIGLIIDGYDMMPSRIADEFGGNDFFVGVGES